MLPERELIQSEFTLYIAEEDVILHGQDGYLEKVITSKGKKNNDLAYEYFSKVVASIGDKDDINVDDIKKLKSCDNEQLAVQAYILNYTNEFDFEHICPACNEPSDQMIDLASLPFRKLDSSVVKTRNPIIELLLPGSKVAAVVGMLDGYKESLITQQSSSGNWDTNFSDFQALQKLDGSERFSYEDVVGLPLKDHKAIRKARRKLICGYDTRVRVTCPYCFNKSSFGLLQHKDFLLPLA